MLWPHGPVCPHCGGEERITEVKGDYQHRVEKRLHNYVAEFDFQHNHHVKHGLDDRRPFGAVLLGFVSRSLTYRDSCAARWLAA